VSQRTRESWQIVFFIAAGVYAVGGIIYCVLASGSIQPWAIDKTKTTVELEVVDEQEQQSEDLQTQTTQ